MDDARRQLPQVDALAARAGGDVPRPVAVAAARSVIADARRSLEAGADPGDLDAAVRFRLQATAPLRSGVNASGVLTHTNLGRAPQARAGVLPGAVDLEYDLAAGRRGGRLTHLEQAFAVLTGSEDAFVVNNNAGAVLLAVAAVVENGGVVVSRGELVEIGGGFRIPDVVTAAGARLVEVGTTNRTHADDYRRALAADVARAVLKVHPSNYVVTGHTAEVTVEALAALCAEAGVPLLADLGSGLLDTATPWLPGGPPPWLAAEPAARQWLAGGAALIAFSGDKLLGGPQAGILCGDGDLVARCRRHPLARALRLDRVRAGLLQDVTAAYLSGDAADLPFWRMATAPEASLAERATRIAAGLPADLGAVVVPTDAVAGAGAAPGRTIPSRGVACLAPGGVADGLARLRCGDPAVVAVATGDRIVADLRSVPPDEDAVLADALAALARPGGLGT